MGTSEKQLADMLGSVPLFASTTKRQRRNLARLGKMLDWKAGAEVITEGSRGAAFFLLLDGGVEVTRDGRPLARLGAGDFVGEMALLTNSPRTATVTATHDSSVFALGKPAFNAAVHEDPKMALAVLEAVAQRTAAGI